MEKKTNYLVVRMKAIEQELEGLRKRLQPPAARKRTVKIEGLWEGADITEDDVSKAKRSLFKIAYGS